MVLKGHVSDGVIVLDDPAQLPEGTQVFISLKPLESEDTPSYLKYRGKPYSYKDPFESAAPEEDWAASGEEAPDKPS
jgi:hypothetical protein